MTDPRRSHRPFTPAPRTRRTRLMLGCGSSAMALALLLATPQRAAAQGILAGADVVAGSAEVTNVDATTTRVDVFSPTAVINWTPQTDNSGNALDFLRTGSRAIFRAAQGDNFAVLNRILPTANNNIVVINGSVFGEVRNAQGQFVPGGFVAFYSPTGILVGETATFDVGSLLLTTLDTTPASFDDFVGGGFLTLQGEQGSRARVQINPRARISALRENSFFAVVAAEVQMSGTARVNGSHAYVAGELVNLRLSNGLFDISIPVGTASSGQVVTIDGSVGGPSSTGIDDNHMIYALARASQDPISMLFRGNLGFDPAQSAGIINGEIILAANYNVNGRNVDTGSIRDEYTAVEFRGTGATSTVRADITLRDLTATSSVLAIGTGQTVAFATEGSASYAGNLWLVGSLGAGISASAGNTMTINGDVLVDARDYGVVSSSLQSLDAINATGGSAQILVSGANSVLNVGGRVTVTAEAFGGADDINRIAGSARGGLAEIAVSGGRVSIGGLTSVRASAFGTSIGGIRTGATMRGGDARVLVSGGGQVTFGDNLIIQADATGADGDTANPSTASDVFSGSALLAINGSGAVGVRGDLLMSANAFAFANSSTTAEGALADAGGAEIAIEGSDSALTIDGQVTLSALAAGGSNQAGRGGRALGGAARATTRNGGSITVAGQFLARAGADGGTGVDGGEGLGGLAGANAVTGTITLGGDAFADASGRGGGADFGLSGTGGIGRGGNAFFQANGTANQRARVAIAGLASARADGSGGNGGRGDSAANPGGAGGDGFGGDFSTPNQADANFNNGAFILAGGDYGEIEVGGEAFAFAQGTGGRGGNSPSEEFTGRGGNGFGGLAQAGLALLGGPGTVGGGLANFNLLTVDATGFGGSGGVDESVDEPRGIAGNGTAGVAVMTVRSGTVNVGDVLINAIGFGGTGRVGGTGTGGTAGILGGQGGRLTSGFLTLLAGGSGGFAVRGRGGDGIGGTAAIEGDGLTIVVNNGAVVDASGSGAASADGAGGDGRGGEAYIGFVTDTAGSITIAGHTQVFANAEGGASQTDFAAGNAVGGLAYIQARGGNTIRLRSAQAVATGRGGVGGVHEGGNGVGGTAELRSLGTGSRLIIESNVPNDFITSPGGGAILSADGFGGNTNGGDGIGGEGRGGRIALLATGGSIALPLDPTVDPAALPEILLSARGRGGDSAVEGGAGGIGSGGNALIEVDGTGAELITGQTVFTVLSQGGSSALSTSNINGGAAFGGSRVIRVLNGGEATLGLIGGASGGEGGDGSGTGNGGNATGGRNQVELSGGTLNIIGTLLINDQSTGGDGHRGGDVFSNGESGVLIFGAENSTITFAADPQGQPGGIAMGGTNAGGQGGVAGGNAQGASVQFSLFNTDLAGGFLRIDTRAAGGSVIGPAGPGGNATAGSVVVSVIDSTVALAGEVRIASIADGGDGGSQDGEAGDAISGAIEVTLEGSSLTVNETQTSPGVLRIESIARGGQLTIGGDATSGRVVLDLDNSTLTADQLYVSANAFADRGPGATARGGEATITLGGVSSTLTADLIEIAANALTSTTGRSFGGTASLLIREDSDSSVNTPSLRLFGNGAGSTDAVPQNAAGRFVISLSSGAVNAARIFATAAGNRIEGDPQPSLLRASAGRINVAESLEASAFGSILIETAQEGVIGTPANVTATVTDIDITSQDLIEIVGDDDAFAGLRGLGIQLSSRRLEIFENARIAAQFVGLASLNTDFTAVLGGTVEGEGWSLTAAEAARITGRELSIFVPEVRATSDPNQPDLLIRDLTLIGSRDGGFTDVGIRAGDATSGIIRIDGNLLFEQAATTDVLALFSGERIELVTPGSIRMSDDDGEPGS